MDAIGTDQHIALGLQRIAAIALLESGHHAIATIRKRDQAAAGAQRIVAQPCTHRIEQHAMQLAAMNGKLRRIEARVGAAQLAPNHLAEAVGIDQLARANAGAIERRQQAESGKFLDRVWQRVDANAEFAQLAHLLEHGARDTNIMQRQRRRQPADPTADDQDVHRITAPSLGPAAHIVVVSAPEELGAYVSARTRRGLP